MQHPITKQATGTDYVELTFNDYNQVTKSGVSSPKVPDAKYKITDISLEYEIATQPDLMSSVRSEYQHMTCCMTEFSDIEKL